MTVLDRAREFRIVHARPVVAEGIKLPPAWIRLGGHNFSNDADFLAGAERDIDRLESEAGLASNTRVLDIGCGVGRLAIGLKRRYGALSNYTGIDVDRARIRWCQRNIDPNSFLYLDLANARYNPEGAVIDERFHFDIPAGSVDLIYLYSVFSHMETPDIAVYLREFARLLSPQGKVFMTAFVEDEVPNVSINPPDFRLADGNEWSGALHCVRYERGYFEGLIADAGLTVERFRHASDTDGQSCLILAPDHDSAAAFQPPL